MRTELKDISKFGIVLGIVLSIIGTIQLLKGNTRIYPWFYIAGVLSFSLGFFVPVALKPVYFLFNRITHAIGSFITGLVLVIIFYIVLTPIGLIGRLFGKNFLDINWAKETNTYWIKKEQTSAGTERYEKQF